MLVPCLCYDVIYAVAFHTLPKNCKYNLVSFKFSRYRGQTEKWLLGYGIVYSCLLLKKCSCMTPVYFIPMKHPLILRYIYFIWHVRHVINFILFDKYFFICDWLNTVLLLYFFIFRLRIFWNQKLGWKSLNKHNIDWK